MRLLKTSLLVAQVLVAMAVVNDAWATPVTLEIEFTSTNGLPVMGQGVPAGDRFSGTAVLDADLTIDGIQDVGVFPTFEFVVGGTTFQRNVPAVVFVDVSAGLISGIQISTGILDFGNSQSGGFSTTTGSTWRVLREAEPFNINEGRGTYLITSQIPEPSTALLLLTGLLGLAHRQRPAARGDTPSRQPRG